MILQNVLIMDRNLTNDVLFNLITSDITFSEPDRTVSWSDDELEDIPRNVTAPIFEEDDEILSITVTMIPLVILIIHQTRNHDQVIKKNYNTITTNFVWYK